MIEAQAQEYKRSNAYQEALAKKRKKRGQSAVPSPMTGDVYGSPEQISERLQKKYAAGEIPADVSADIVENKSRPGQYEVYFSETGGYKERQQPSVIKYSSYKTVQDPTVDMNKGRYIYELDVSEPEQARDVKIWAAVHGHQAERATNEDYAKMTAAQLNKLSAEERQAAGQIRMRIYTDAPLPEDTSIDIRTSEALLQERSERGAGGIGRKIYSQANVGEKILLNVRTALSPAGYEYVGAVAREQGGPINRALIDLAFPNIPSSQSVVEKDIERRTAKAARGKTTTNIMGVEVDDRIVSAINNPIVEIELMALGGAGLGAAAATGTGAKIITSTAGKLTAAGLTGLYAGERTGKVLTLRSEGKSAEALGTGITAIAGLGAGAAAFKAQYSFLTTAKAANVVKVETRQIKGGSISKQIGKSTSISRGKFTITEGRLKGLTGDTVSLSGKKGGLQVTKIPQQSIGSGKSKIKISEQTFRSFTEHGVVSKKLKISWRKAGDMLLQIKGEGKVYNRVTGPRKEASLMQEVGRRTGNLKISKKVPGGGEVQIKREAVIRKFSGLSAGTVSYTHLTLPTN